jgi:hypothetical protein
VTLWIILSLAAFIVVLTVLSIYGVIPALRLVPDVTTFDFIRFRRISFPISAVLSILAIVLFFYAWAEFRHRLPRRHAARDSGKKRAGRYRRSCAPSCRISALAKFSCNNSAVLPTC